MPHPKGMLILSRRPNESVVIDETVTLTVLEVRGNQVRLGLVAPREVNIARSELLKPPKEKS